MSVFEERIVEKDIIAGFSLYEDVRQVPVVFVGLGGRKVRTLARSISRWPASRSVPRSAVTRRRLSEPSMEKPRAWAWHEWMQEL